MNGNQWYQYQQSPPEYPRNGQQRQYPPPQPNPAMATAGVDSVHDARRLLGTYPLASATPTTHGTCRRVPIEAHTLTLYSVSRHLSGLSLTATPPTYYVQPTMYSLQYAPAPQQYQRYNEYGPELSHLSSSAAPYNDGGYWERTRNEAVRYIGEQTCVTRPYNLCQS